MHSGISSLILLLSIRTAGNRQRRRCMIQDSLRTKTEHIPEFIMLILLPCGFRLLSGRVTSSAAGSMKGHLRKSLISIKELWEICRFTPSGRRSNTTSSTTPTAEQERCLHLPVLNTTAYIFCLKTCLPGKVSILPDGTARPTVQGTLTKIRKML